MMGIKKESTNTIQPEQSTYETTGFCAVLSRSGSQSIQSENLDDFEKFRERSIVSWVDCVVEDVARDSCHVASKFGFTEPLVTRLLSHQRSGYVDFDSEMGILLPAIRVSGFKVTLDPLLLLMQKDLLLTIHTRETERFYHIRRYAETFLQKLRKDMGQIDKLTLLLIRIVDESNSRDFEHLQEIEESADRLSEDLSNLKTPRDSLSDRIYQMKHALIIYLGGLWATAEALGELRYGDAELISDEPEILGKISGLIQQVHSQLSMSEHLSDVLASGLEVLQSIYNNQLQILNNRLAMLVGYLTIIGTALLVPNTIATVMSQTNIFVFSSSDYWWYLALLAVSTIIATYLSWWAVKKMNLLPTRPDTE